MTVGEGFWQAICPIALGTMIARQFRLLKLAADPNKTLTADLVGHLLVINRCGQSA
jgi:hypothetical protein